MFNRTNPLAPLHLKPVEKAYGLSDFVVGLGTEFTEKRSNRFGNRNKSFAHNPSSSRRSNSEAFKIDLSFKKNDTQPLKV